MLYAELLTRSYTDKYRTIILKFPSSIRRFVPAEMERRLAEGV
jgi:hypothetical protein